MAVDRAKSGRSARWRFGTDRPRGRGICTSRPPWLAPAEARSAWAFIVRIFALPRAACVAIAAVLALPTDAYAGAWTLKAGTGQAIVSGLVSEADRTFDDDGDPALPADFRKASAFGLVEYGLTDDLTVFGVGELGSESAPDGHLGDAALRELGLGARLMLFRSGGFVGSAQLSGRFEDDDRSEPFAERFGWDAPGVELRGLLGYGFTLMTMPAFVDLEAAYRYRTGEGPDEFKLDATAGVRPFEKIQLLAQVFSTLSAGPEPADGFDSYAYHKLQASLVYDFNERWSVQGGGFGTIAGRNAVDEHGLIAALWYRF